MRTYSTDKCSDCLPHMGTSIHLYLCGVCAHANAIIRTCTSTEWCIRTYVRMLVRTRVHTYVCIRVCVCVCVCVCVRCTCVCVCMCMYVHTYVHVYTLSWIADSFCTYMERGRVN